jgi:hypothetical protein
VGINSLLAGELEFHPPPVTKMKAKNEYWARIQFFGKLQ